MAPTFRIHRPDVLASLPRPLDHTKGQYHIGEVYTQKAGSKKRKRLEVVVGVDGEAANIYHVSFKLRCLSGPLLTVVDSFIRTANFLPDPASRVVHLRAALNPIPRCFRKWSQQLYISVYPRHDWCQDHSLP